MTQHLPIAINLNNEGGLATYVQTVNAIPVLSGEQELELAHRYRTKDDLEAARELILAHLRHVVFIARKFKGYGLPQADLIQEGNIGLMKAVKHFDPERGVRLISFAVHWIRAEIYEYVLRNWCIVKVATTKAQRKLFFNLRKARASLSWLSQHEVDTMAEDLNVTRKDVQEMEGRLSGTDVAFDAVIDSDDDDFQAAPAGYLQDMRFNPEAIVVGKDHEDAQNTQLAQALAGLDERSRTIIQRRWLNDDKATLHKLAAEFGISAERVRQIEKKAMTVMKQGMLKA